jgi:CheY-like chemotaxis protein
MSGLKMMMFNNETGRDIKCRFISEWCKVDSFLPDKERLLSEIEKNNPDVVFMDLDLYSVIDGIKTSQQIRHQYNIPVLYNV